MLIDIIVFVLLLLALFKGMRRGLIVAVFSLLGFIIGLAAAIKLSAVVAVYIGHSVNVSERWLPVLAFSLVFFIVVFLVRLGAKALEGAAGLAMLGWANKVGGFLFYALLYIFIFSILLFYSTQLGVVKEQAIASSGTYPFIQPLAPKVLSGLSALLPFFKNLFAQLQLFFDGVAKTAAG